MSDRRPSIGEWFIYRPTRGRPVRVRCTGYRGDTLGKAGWIETIDETGFIRSIAPALAVRGAIATPREPV